VTRRQKLEEQARSLGALRRVRAVASASSLLRALLCYVLSLSSLPVALLLELYACRWQIEILFKRIK
jgi:IS4 transposase